MRVLYVDPPSSMTAAGGIETYAKELQSAIAARGHQVERLTTEPTRVLSDTRLLDRRPMWSFRERYYYWRAVYVQDHTYHAVLRRHMRAALRSFTPDVVHALHVYPYGALAGMRVPYVISAYGLEVEAAPPILKGCQGAAAVHAISDFTASLVQGVAPTLRPTVLRWGIRPAPPRSEHADFDLVTVSRLVRRKNIDTVLRALPQCGALRYAIVGDGPERQALERLAAEEGLTNVTFFGEVSNEVRADVLHRSRLFVMSARHAAGDVEGLGLVYYEAAGAGLPVVASRSGGVPEAVGDAGLLVNDPDPAELARAIRDALEPQRYAAIRQACARRQRGESWQRFVDQFEALYRSAQTAPRSR